MLLKLGNFFVFGLVGGLEKSCRGTALFYVVTTQVSESERISCVSGGGTWFVAVMRLVESVEISH